MYLVELLERMPANKNVLDMGRKLMTEIRRYQNPPPAMHRIMQSALLLLGEDEDTTDVKINVISCTSVTLLIDSITISVKNKRKKQDCLQDLRPTTTRECVHLVTHGHFRSRDKDGGHTIRSAIAETTGAALLENNETSAKVTTKYGRR